MCATPGARPSLFAQELPLRPEYAGSAGQCAPWTPPPEPGRDAIARASEMASHANNALVLGDLERARELLVLALELRGASAELLYRYGRVLEDLGAHAEAVEALCRVLALDGEGEEHHEEARARLDWLRGAARRSLPAPATAAFDRAVVSAQAGRFGDAAESFSRAAEEAPDWSLAAYNSGVTLDRLGRTSEAAEQLSRYLELEPEAEDAIAVAQRIGQLNAVGADPPDPRVAFTFGLLAPGMGQLYSRRPSKGLLVLSLAGGAVAAGLFVREVEVRCVVEPQGGGPCPPEYVQSSRTDRPYLGLSALAAGIVTALGALEAFLHARHTPEPATPAVVSHDAARIGGPTVAVGPRGVDVTFLRLPTR